MMDSDFIVRDGVLEKYIGTESGKIRIPSGVVKIAPHVFRGVRAEKAYIPNGVTEIGEGAFYGCSLSELYLPPSVEHIGSRAFYSCSCLTHIGGGSGLRKIDDRAFSGCKGLTHLSLESCEELGVGAFADCSALMSVALPKNLAVISDLAFMCCESLTEADIPSGVKEIPPFCFFGCRSLSRVRLPDGLETVGDSAFGKCRSLSEIDIPDTVTQIGTSALSYCRSLGSVELPRGIESISDFTFLSSGITSVKIPEGVTEIGEGAFDTCNYLSDAILPSSVKKIGSRAFYYCNRVDISRAMNSIEEIGERAFAECFFGSIFAVPKKMTMLTDIFGEGLPKIIIAPHLSIDVVHPKCRRATLFGNWTILQTGGEIPEDILDGYIEYARRIKKRLYNDAAEIPGAILFLTRYKILPLEDADYLLEFNTLDTESRAALMGYKNELMKKSKRRKKTELDLLLEDAPATVRELRRLFSYIENEDGTLTITSYKGRETRVTVPEYIGGKRVTAIGRIAFSPARRQSTDIAKSTARTLESVELPGSIREIGSGAFDDCVRLERVNIPKSTVKIQSHAFCGCESLRELIFESDLYADGLEIYGSAFLGCKSMVKIRLPEGARLMGTGIFWGCELLKVAVLPRSVTEIADYVFGQCTSLTEVVVTANEVTLSPDWGICLNNGCALKVSAESNLAKSGRDDVEIADISAYYK